MRWRSSNTARGVADRLGCVCAGSPSRDVPKAKIPSGRAKDSDSCAARRRERHCKPTKAKRSTPSVPTIKVRPLSSKTSSMAGSATGATTVEVTFRGLGTAGAVAAGAALTAGSVVGATGIGCGGRGTATGAGAGAGTGFGVVRDDCRRANSAFFRSSNRRICAASEDGCARPAPAAVPSPTCGGCLGTTRRKCAAAGSPFHART